MNNPDYANLFEWTYSTEKPKEIDTESSSYYVYVRLDIEPYKQYDDDGEVTFDGFKYREAKFSNEDFLADYVKVLTENNEAILLGLCDLYEQNLPTE